MIEVVVISDASEIVLPDSFKCPICGAAIQVEEVAEWFKDDDDNWKAEAVKIDCATFPGYESEDFHSWQRGHWSMPYVDWMPLEKRVTDWVNARYSWQL